MKKIIIFFIKKYRKHVSPFFIHYGVQCKYYPTCSRYTEQAIEKYGTKKGVFLGLKRFCKCNPLSKGGYDPVK